MSAFTTIRKAAFDTETTGPDPNQDRIVTAALVVRGGGRPDHVMSWLINPGVPIPQEAAEVHGIDDAKAAEGADPKEALDDIADQLAKALAYGMPLVAFNLSFDWTVLTRDLERHGLRSMADRLPGARALPLVDPHVIDKQVDKYVKGTGMRKLKPTCDRYGVELEDWHTAEADALAALLIAEAQFERYPRLGDLGPQQLFAAQKTWRAEQQAGLQFEKHADDNSEVYADARQLTVTAVLDAHTTDTARWAGHRVHLQLRETDTWRAWKANDGRLLGQEEFAEFLEDHSAEILEPDAATMLEIAQSIQGVTKAEFQSGTRLSDGRRALQYVETVNARAGNKGQLEVPETFIVGLVPFDGSEGYRVTARLRYRIGTGGGLTIGYRLDRPGEVRDTAFKDVVRAIGEDIEQPVMHGTPA